MLSDLDATVSTVFRKPFVSVLLGMRLSRISPSVSNELNISVSPVTYSDSCHHRGAKDSTFKVEFESQLVGKA